VEQKKWRKAEEDESMNISQALSGVTEERREEKQYKRLDWL
jgi:hypothetical protein